MAYSVDWIGKVVTIPQSDLTLVGGNNYTLDMSAFHIEVRRLESAFDEGLWADQVLNYYPSLTLSGVVKTETLEVINSYQFQFGGSNYNVSLIGADNNLLDVLIPGNGISVTSNNSVGKQTIISGSGLSASEQAQLKALWQRFGLDPANPLTVTPTSINAGDVDQTITGDGETTSTVTHN